MAEQTSAPISHIDIDRLYVDNWTPDSWLSLEKRALELRERNHFTDAQSQALIYALRTLEREGRSVPEDPSQLYLMIRPVLERLPGGYA